MRICGKRNQLTGRTVVPGSKSHTIRALLLATLAEGTSTIHNPLPSADCLSTAAAVPLMGSRVDLNLTTEGCPGTDWVVYGAGKKLHLPTDVINVGNSGSLLYFLSPIAATFDGYSIFTGDESIRKRPVDHVADVLNQMGASAEVSQPGSRFCPLVIKGPVSAKNTIRTEGSASSQYISGLMMAALKLKDEMHIELSDPTETPYLTMTQKWLEKIGAEVKISDDFKSISVKAPDEIKAFDCTIPSDWEAVAFPLVAALISDSDICIDNIDGSGTQGDDAIVGILKSLGADIEWNRETDTIRVRGGKKSAGGIGRLSTENLPGGELHVNLSGFPDAICALSAAACFTEGDTYIEDIAVCRRKETDRISVLKKELEKLGASVDEGSDFMVIHGHSPFKADGSPNPDFALHGAEIESYFDHRVAMALSVMSLGLPEGERIFVRNAECCSVSFPHFFEVMNEIGAGFEIS